MYKTGLAKVIAQNNGMDEKSANEALNAVIGAIEEVLKSGESVQLTGFGTFKVKDYPARTGRNVRTGEAIEIAAHKGITFKASKSVEL